MPGCGYYNCCYLFHFSIERILVSNFSRTQAGTEKRNETFKTYAGPLILTSISLLYRLKEILSNRGDFLKEGHPQNDFNEYKYISTLYRFCNFLGWIRASTIELTYIEVANSEEYQKIENVIVSFQSVLADGQDVELAVLEDICRLWKIYTGSISQPVKSKLGFEIEKLIDVHCFAEKKDIVSQISSQEQLKLARNINHLICTETDHTAATDEALQQSLLDFSKETSRTLGLIYRDWQSAIADIVIIKTNDQIRKFDVTSYKDFENLYLSQDKDTRKWLGRLNKLFKNFDVTVDDRFDGRTKQLRGIYQAVYAILKSFSTIKTSNVDIVKQTISKLPATM